MSRIFLGNALESGRFVGGWCVFVLVEWIRDSFDGCSRGDCGWMVAWLGIVFGTRQFRKYCNGFPKTSAPFFGIFTIVNYLNIQYNYPIQHLYFIQLIYKFLFLYIQKYYDNAFASIDFSIFFETPVLECHTILF